MNLPVEYSLRAALVFALAFAVTRLLHRQPAAFRHVIWICAFLMAAATPVFLRFGPRIQFERRMEQAMAPTISTSPHGSDVSLQPSPAPSSEKSPHREIPFVAIVWATGVFLVGVRMWNARRKARALLKNATLLDIPFDIDAPSIRIGETSAVATAMTLGILRPWILLPVEHRLWTREVLKAVLLHELAHVRRRDCLMQWLPNIVCALYWFNPLAWLARSEMLCESERACDDAVIRSGVSGNLFARDLVEIAQLIHSKAIHSKGDLFMSTAVTTKLERRIARLLDPAANRRPLTAGRAAVGAVLALALLVPIAGVRAEQAFPAPPAPSFPKVTEPKATEDKFAPVPKKARRLTQIAQATSPAQPTQTQPNGSLSGVVRDPSGGVIIGAIVRIFPSTLAGVTLAGVTQATGATGQWSVPNLPDGVYSLEVQVPGFKTLNRAVRINGGTNTEADANLAIGQASESVTVTAARSNPSPALAPPPADANQAVQVGGNVQPLKLIRGPKPVFPQSAKDQGIQGAVTFIAIVGKNGFIQNGPFAVSEAPPELVQAALDAIRQWQYSPALLNGEPVDVMTEITVNFQLQ